MDKFKNALKTTGSAVGSALNTGLSVAGQMIENNQKIEAMANTLMQKTPGLELAQAKLVAKTLMTQAEEINWK